MITSNRPSDQSTESSKFSFDAPGHRVADQFPQIALTGHEADERDRPIHVLRLDQLHQLLRLAVDEAQIRRVAGQPQDQLVQEQDQRVVAQRLGVLGDDRQPLVQIEVGLVLPGRHVVIAAEERADQVAHQAGPFLVARRRCHGCLETGRVPAGGDGAPAAAAGLVLVQLLEEPLIAHVLAQALGVLEQALGQVHARNRGLGVQLPHIVGVLPQDALLHAAAADHVERHQQELLALRPGVVLGHDAGQFRDRPRLGVVPQQQVQHRHEVALAAAEAAVQVAGLARVGIDGALDEAQGLVEAGRQLRRHHVVPQRRRRVGVRHARRQVQDEVALVAPVPGDPEARGCTLPSLPRLVL